jgi:hypothetical protein
MTSLEIGYRRLLACYPRGYRREYEEELLGVLLAAADPGRRRPGARDIIDLLGGALRVHLRQALGRGGGAHWRDACTVAGTILAALMLAQGLPSLIYHVTEIPSLPYPAHALTVVTPAATVLTAAGVWLGRRMLATVAAWATLAATVTGLALDVPVGPGFHGGSHLSAVSALAAAVCLSVPAPPRRGIELIGRRGGAGRWLGLAAAVVLAVAPWAIHSRPTEHQLLPLFLFSLFACAAGIALWSPTGRRTGALLALPLAALVDEAGLTPAIVYGLVGWSELFMIAVTGAVFCLTVLRSRPPRLDTPPRSAQPS